jgi:hypothetical protein
LRTAHGIDLVVIDPLASFLPGRDESNAGLMMQTLPPLQRLTAQGVSVLVLHHPRKGETVAGQAARGSGALSGYVDILVEMEWYTRASDEDRRRRLQAYSRYEATPRQLVIELNADGTDYLSHGDFAEEEFGDHWEALKAVLAGARHKLTRRQVLEAWPEGRVAPAEVSLWRWLERAAAQGLVCQDGSGKKNAPFRYWLPGQVEKWGKDPLHFLWEEPELEPFREDGAGLEEKPETPRTER